jgi:hypothetical protein
MGRLIGLLALLNGVMLVAGLSMEHFRGQPAALVSFNADKVRLLGRVERPAAAKDDPVAAEEVPADVPAEPVKPAEPTTPLAPTPVATRCLAWPALDAGLLSEIETRLRSAGIADSRYDIQLRKRLAWWVYLPPFADAEATQVAIEVARQKGVKDIAPVRGGEMANAVSLGAFPTLAKARAQLEKLRALGVQGMHAGPRPDSGAVRLVIAEDVPEARLAELGKGKDWGKRAPAACEGN